MRRRVVLHYQRQLSLKKALVQRKGKLTDKSIAAPEKATPVGRVFKFLLKGIPVVNAAMEARLETATRVPRKDRHYAVMIEASDA